MTSSVICSLCAVATHIYSYNISHLTHYTDIVEYSNFLNIHILCVLVEIISLCWKACHLYVSFSLATANWREVNCGWSITYNNIIYLFHLGWCLSKLFRTCRPYKTWNCYIILIIIIGWRVLITVKQKKTFIWIYINTKCTSCKNNSLATFFHGKVYEPM